MSKREVPRELSRLDHIKEESKRALEHGQSPRRPISLARNFRVESMVPVPSSPASTIAPSCEEAFRSDFDFKGAMPRARNPYLRPACPAALRAFIEARLEHTDARNPERFEPELLTRFGDLAAAIPDVKSLETLHERVLIATFGAGYFKNIGGREGSRTPRK